MRCIQALVLVLITICLTVPICSADNYPTFPTTGNIQDTANVISASDKIPIQAYADSLYNLYGIKYYVLTISAPAPDDNFYVNLFNYWGLSTNDFIFVANVQTQNIRTIKSNLILNDSENQELLNQSLNSFSVSWSAGIRDFTMNFYNKISEKLKSTLKTADQIIAELNGLDSDGLLDVIYEAEKKLEAIGYHFPTYFPTYEQTSESQSQLQELPVGHTYSNGDYICVDSYQVSNNIITVKYTFSHSSNYPYSFNLIFLTHLYQNGVELKRAFSKEDNESTSKPALKNEKYQVSESFLLQNDSPIEIHPKNFIREDDDFHFDFAINNQ